MFNKIISHQRGRPTVSSEDRRSRNIQIRVTEEVYEDLRRLAQKNGISLSTFGRTVLEEAVDKEKDLSGLGYGYEH